MSGEGMDGSQQGTNGLGHPWATYMSPKLFLLLACLRPGLRWLPSTTAVEPLHFIVISYYLDNKQASSLLC
jgi:hypothetical protein